MSKHQLEPEHWIDRYGDVLLNYALLRIPERDIARDLVQDTFVSALNTVDTFRGEASEKSWLFLILRSRILDYYKKKKEVIQSDLQGQDADDADDDFFDEKGFWLPDKRPQDWSTDRAIASKEFMQVLDGCLKRLKAKQRDAFAMKYLEDLETEEICKELSVSSSNYWILIHRAKLQLRSCLEQTWLN